MVAESPPRWHLAHGVRKTVARFADVACPPGVRTPGRTDRVISEFELLLGAIQAGPRRLLGIGFAIVDRRARLYPPARGRRLTRLDEEAANAYLAMLLGSRGSVAAIARRLKGLIVMCYYELPEVQEELGYRPAGYIAAVSRRRLASYGAEIRAGERAVLAGSPLDPGRATGAPTSDQP